MPTVAEDLTDYLLENGIRTRYLHPTGQCGAVSELTGSESFSIGAGSVQRRMHVGPLTFLVSTCQLPRRRVRRR